jgi:rhodanese-related sulfurtransferase
MRQLVKGATALVTEAKAGIENLTPAQVAAELRRPGVVVVDLRERDEVVRDGMIEGAVHVPRGLLEFVADPSHAYHNPKLNPDARVILHCASGGRSALAARTLKEMGYASVAHLDGGFTAWKVQGHPIAMV